VQNMCFRSVAARLQRCWYSVGQRHLKDFPLACLLCSLKIAKNAKNSSSHSTFRVASFSLAMRSSRQDTLSIPHSEFRTPCSSLFRIPRSPFPVPHSAFRISRCSQFRVVPLCLLLSA